LPRAHFVPRIEVVPDDNAILDRLASAAHNPRRGALVERPPGGGFPGAPGPAGPGALPPTGTVTLEDRSELVTLHVTATGPGFLVLSDQYYPGWVGDVNGQPAPILPANQ